MHTDKTCCTIGAFSNITRVPSNLDNLDVRFSSDYMRYLNPNSYIWTQYYPDIIFRSNSLNKKIRDKATEHIKFYAYKHVVLDNIWNKIESNISNSTKYTKGSKTYTITQAKNHYKGVLGYIGTYETKSEGFKLSVHVKMKISDESGDILSNFMFFVGSGSCNITGVKDKNDIKNGMMFLMEQFDDCYYHTDIPKFFIKHHMIKLIVTVGANKKTKLVKNRSRLQFDDVKRLIRNNVDNNDYRVIRINNDACMTINIRNEPNGYDLFSLNDSIWFSDNLSLIDIHEKQMVVTAPSVLKDYKRQKEELDECDKIVNVVSVKISLVSKKIEVACNRYEDGVNIRDMVVGLLKELY